MILCFQGVTYTLISIPRRRGGDPVVSNLPVTNSMLFPAGAGVIPTLNNLITKYHSIPRRRGGDPRTTDRSPIQD